MKKAALIARYLFGVLWIVFSLNFFFHFLPQPPPSDLGMKFLSGLMSNPVFFPFMKTIELVGGILLLANIAVPFALVILAPITVNIFLYHTIMDPGNAPLAILMLVLHVFLGIAYFETYKPLFRKG
jgi:hypothetical protein